MGLHAWVRCTCIADGKTRPHPLPDLLRYDENGDPFLDWNLGITESDWALHEAWSKTGCSHEGGYLVFKRLGNIASIAHLREYISPLASAHFALLLETVVASGTHGGDSIPMAIAQRLLIEVHMLRAGTSDEVILDFATDLIELCEASVATGNPIVF